MMNSLVAVVVCHRALPTLKSAGEAVDTMRAGNLGRTMLTVASISGQRVAMRAKDNGDVCPMGESPA
jgi:hypothetical protein